MLKSYKHVVFTAFFTVWQMNDSRGRKPCSHDRCSLLHLSPIITLLYVSIKFGHLLRLFIYSSMYLFDPPTFTIICDTYAIVLNPTCRKMTDYSWNKAWNKNVTAINESTRWICWTVEIYVSKNQKNKSERDWEIGKMTE